MHVMWRVAVVVGLVTARGWGEEIEFFRASTAGVEAWSWGGAKVKAQGADLRIAEANPDAVYGDAYIADRLPYLEGGVLDVDVSAIESGRYTLQVLGFKGDAHVYTAEPVKDQAQAGAQRVRLPAAGLQPDTQSVLLKFWVGGEGAAVRLRELTYRATVRSEQALLDEHFDDPAAWQVEADHLAVAAAAPGLRFQLQGAHTFAPAALARPFELAGDRLLLAHVAAVPGGVTVQIETFDATGAFVGAVDVLKSVGAGWHGAALGNVDWPSGAIRGRVKLWVSGAAGAGATLDRLMVVPR